MCPTLSYSLHGECILHEHSELRIPYPEELPASAYQTPEEFEREVRFLVAAKLYELGRVTSDVPQTWRR